jgi:hypothetical protein
VPAPVPGAEDKSRETPLPETGNVCGSKHARNGAAFTIRAGRRVGSVQNRYRLISVAVAYRAQIRAQPFVILGPVKGSKGNERLLEKAGNRFVSPLSGCQRQPTYDLILSAGRIVDGSGNAWFYGDVAVRGDRLLVRHFIL